MLSFLSPDSWFMKCLTRAADLILLNILFLLTSVPIVTIGASAAALYTVIFPMGTVRDKGAIRAYLAAFKENFKKATLAWLGLLAVLVILIADYFLMLKLPGAMGLAAIFPVVLMIILGMTLSYLFPLMSQFDNTLKESVKNALILSLGSLPRAVLILAINVFPWALLVFKPYFFFSFAFMWVAGYFSCGAYLACLLLRKTFRPYLPEDAFDPEELQEGKD